MTVNKRGAELLLDPSLNKSTAFTEAEKQALGLAARPIASLRRCGLGKLMALQETQPIVRYERAGPAS